MKYEVYEVYDSITEDSYVLETFNDLEAAKNAARALAEEALSQYGEESYLANRYDDDAHVEWAIHTLYRGNWETRTPYYGVKEA